MSRDYAWRERKKKKKMSPYKDLEERRRVWRESQRRHRSNVNPVASEGSAGVDNPAGEAMSTPKPYDSTRGDKGKRAKPITTAPAPLRYPMEGEDVKR